MADKKISALTAASTPLAGTEVLPIVQSGSTVKVAVSDLTAGRAVTGLSFNGLSLTANSAGYSIAGGTSSKTMTFNNSLTLAGTDSTTMTFPSTSATIARTDASNTFTGAQSMTGALSVNTAGGSSGAVLSSIYQSLSTSTTYTCTISGLQYGVAEVTLGGYIPAGGGYFSIKVVLGGYQASTGTYDVTTLVNAQSGNAQIGVVTKNNSTVTFTIRNNSGTQPLNLGGTILYISGAPVTVTIA